MSPRVLERERELATLADAGRRAADGHGSVVLVTGEAGIGKSALLAALRAQQPADGRFLVGTCDDLGTPRLLGPFRDLAGLVGAELSRALRGDDRDQLFAALHHELDWPGHPTVLAVEDVHWADEATLDVLRYLVRRIADLPTVLVLTYRDDEVGRSDPLRPLLSAVASGGRAVRLPLAPLSPAAVRELGTDRDDAETVFSLTGGNPFLVHELLASAPGSRVPTNVVDVVLARLHRLSPESVDAVERLSVITSAVDRELVDALVPGGLVALDEAEEHGLLTIDPRRVSFRHELTRRAVVDALPASRRTTLHAAALAALEASGGADLAQLVHHATEAGAPDAIVRHALPAARSAAHAGAHRAAAAHYRLALAHRGPLPPGELADLLEASAIECYTVGDLGRSAMSDQAEAVELRRELEDRVALGRSLRWLSRIRWWCGDGTGAEIAGEDAVAVLIPTGDRHELALAYSNTSQLAMLGDRTAEACRDAERAITLAREVDDPAVLSHALNNLGTARWAAGDPAGRATLEEALEVAVTHELSEHASRAYCNLVWQLLVQLQPRAAALLVEDGIVHAERAEHVVFWKYLHVERALLALAAARWKDTVADARIGLDATSPIRCTALFALGRAALRTGEPAQELIDECWVLGQGLAELQRIVPAASLICEEAWLRDDLGTVRRIAAPLYAEALRLEAVAWQMELGHWLVRAGVAVDLGGLDHPYASLARGDWRAAADAWADAGYPYEEAWALSESDDETVVLSALARLDLLGAVPLAARVRSRLREQGTVRVPRGPTRATRGHPGGLTPRQVDVLHLLGEGLSNADMADRLVLSVRTVDRHLADLMRKLGASSRAEALQVARERDWL